MGKEVTAMRFIFWYAVAANAAAASDQKESQLLVR